MRAVDSTILVVEDDVDHAFLIGEAFAGAKLVNPIQIVSDGDQAIAYLQGTGEYADRDRYPLPILVLLDLHLPRRSGLEVLEWMRQQPELARTPVVMLTASRAEEDITRAYALGATSYLVKPVGFDGLLEVVQALGLYWVVLNQRPQDDAP